MAEIELEVAPLFELLGVVDQTTVGTFEVKVTALPSQIVVCPLAVTTGVIQLLFEVQILVFLSSHS